MRKILGSDTLSEVVINEALESITFADTADASTTQEALANLGAGVRPSRIINGGFKINQRGMNSYTGSWSYCFDGWVISSDITAVREENGDIHISNSADTERYLLQRIEDPIFDTPSTLSVITTDGAFSVTGIMESLGHNGFSTPTSFGKISVEWDGTRQYITIAINSRQSIKLPASTGVVIKFEEGVDQTLYYKESDSSIALIPQPDNSPHQILADCQRHVYSPFYGAFPTAPIGTVFASNQTTGFVHINTPVLMRTKPVFLGDPSKLWIVKSNGGGAQRPSALSVMGMSGSGVFLSVSASFESDGQYIMYSEDVSNPADFLLSAEM